LGERSQRRNFEMHSYQTSLNVLALSLVRTATDALDARETRNGFLQISTRGKLE
jgi:hypothetical protein